MQKKLLVSCLSFLLACSVWSQDPVTTQFFNTPLAVNPAYAAEGTSDFQVFANYRQQWFGSSASYNTALASFYGSLLSVEKGAAGNLGIGGMLMTDQSLQGAYKTAYASLNLAYLLSLDDEGNSRLGVGLAGIYGNRRIDFSQLTFISQFSSRGFNTSLPTGENALANMSNYFSVGAGILFTHQLDGYLIKVGAGGYHFNTPRQTLVTDVYEEIPTRYTAHGSVKSELSSQLSMELSAIYQSQAGNSFFSGGAIFGFMPNGVEGGFSIDAGAFYRNTKTFSPYLGVQFNKLNAGLSYDLNMDNKGLGLNSMRAWELGVRFGVGGN